MKKPAATKPPLTRRERRAQAHLHSDRSPAPAKRPAGYGDFSAPQDLDGIAAVMGAGSDVYALMPAYKDIPEEFRSMNDRTPFNRLQSEWFFKGFPNGWPLTPRPGIDAAKAWAHLNAIQRSWTPPHEHKAAGVAYLMSLWFEAPKV